MEDSTAAHSTYIRKALKAPKLGREEEQALIRRYQDKDDQRAGDKLARAHLRTVVFLARKYQRYGVPLSDLISAGNVGLVHALGKFDPERGVRFRTYADYWIRAYMVRHMVRSWSMVTGGYSALEPRLFFKLRREAAKAKSLLGDNEAAEAALAEQLDLPVERLSTMLRRVQERDVSLDVPLTADASTTRLDLLVSQMANQEDVVGSVEARERLKKAVREAVETLDDRERYIAENRLLVDSEDRLTLQDIGAKYKVSRERVRQLEVLIKQKLQKRLASKWKAEELPLTEGIV
ncbi:MAG: sigma-70 family RNA polymerase sigma factor [Myxococcota bacterium]